jgi:predicted nuclease with TOPRIM domain
MAILSLNRGQLGAVLGLAVLVSTGCQKRAEVRQQIEEVKVTLRERTAEVKKLDADLANAGGLGRYNSPQKTHFDELNLRITTLKKETAKLTEERDDQKKIVQQINKELEEYQTKYGR